MDSKIREISENDVPEFENFIYKNTVLLRSYLSVADSIENFEVREDDIWLCGFPKSGTTWSQEMVWNIAKDLDFETSKVKIYERFPLFEYSGMIGYQKSLSNDYSNSPSPAYLENSLEYVNKLSSPRFIKTHLPFHLLPRQLRTNEKNAKLVYVWRNPKDACISFYHFSKWLNKYHGDFANYCELFLNDKVAYTPFWNHVLEFWNRRNEPNNLVLKYEDMKADLHTEIRRTAKFLGKSLTDNQISELEKHLSFSSMSANPAVSHDDLAEVHKCNTDMKFLRKGEADQWKTVMSSEMINRFDTWIRQNLKNNERLLREVL